MKVYLPELNAILSGVIAVDLLESCHPAKTYRVRFVFNQGSGSVTLPESFEDLDLAGLMIAQIAREIELAGKDGIAQIDSGNLISAATREQAKGGPGDA